MEDMHFMFSTDEEVELKKYFVVICYDICDNKKRGKLVKYLEKFAVRVQKSVFEGYLTKKNFTKLKNGIAGYISDEDSLRIYKLTGNGDVLSWGKGDIPENEDYIII